MSDTLTCEWCGSDVSPDGIEAVKPRPTTPSVMMCEHCVPTNPDWQLAGGHRD